MLTYSNTSDALISKRYSHEGIHKQKTNNQYKIGNRYKKGTQEFMFNITYTFFYSYFVKILQIHTYIWPSFIIQTFAVNCTMRLILFLEYSE